ncbi:MAG: RidA family protein [Phycisphaerales bacterium]|nr:RidA family protein [Phycisphaerales bacterium]
MKPSQRLKELGITLPTAPAPVGSYVPGIRTGNLVMVSGQIPIKDGVITVKGKVGRDVTLEEANGAARQCALNALAIAAETAGGVDVIARIVRLAVYVDSAPGFTDQPKVANGASDLMVEVFGDAGKHVRAAVGANELPLGSAVEVELLAEVDSA